jgi:hypothetical protein
MHLGKYNREYPEAWSIVDRLRADRGKGLPWWPDWCFLPLEAYNNLQVKVDQR